ncbi:MAG: glycosidase [Candidatus Aenigmarchaeota archaeon]|nr:glycosidase [Candidatus Aenigmarchaeota archaeon]
MELVRRGLVLSPDDNISAIFNSGASKYDGYVLLFPRVITRDAYESYISSIGCAQSTDGRNFTLSCTTFIQSEHSYENQGCEDPRITKLEDEYYITYTAVSNADGNRHVRSYVPGLASTKDFSSVRKHGPMFPDKDKDVVVFPEDINGKVAVLHRVEPDIQIVYYKDLENLKAGHDAAFWKEYLMDIGRHTVLQRQFEWESMKIGAGPPPIKTEQGWLLIYHGVDNNRVYSTGAALLDHDDPQKVIARSPYPILAPATDYEMKGDVNNVVLAAGAVELDNELFVYYGAGDKRCALATCNRDALVTYLLEHRNVR